VYTEFWSITTTKEYLGIKVRILLKWMLNRIARYRMDLV